MRHDFREKLDIIEQFLERLAKIHQWFEVQEVAHFYASSILFVYEGYSQAKPLVNVKMIDFSHVFMAERESCVAGKDHNYIYGLKNIYKTFSDIMKGIQQNEL